MAHIRLLCLDIDGTLLNSKNEVTPATRAALQRAQKAGILPVLVSARMPKGIQPLADDLGLPGPIISFSGGMISHRDHVLKSTTLPLSLVRRLCAQAGAHDVHLSIYQENHWYVNRADAWARQEAEITHTSFRQAELPSLFEAWEKNGQSANKLMVLAEPEKVDALQKELQEAWGTQANIYPSKPTYLEIMPGGVSKTSAISFLMDAYGFSREEVMAIGDNYNDVSMLSFAGLGVAMGNAPLPVQQQADAVTAANDADGVAKAIETYCLA